jgi:putative tryptophan/tyrosine transport system substrate-binding protein
MRRRDFITAIAGSAASWPLAAGAQQSSHVRRIGVLMTYAEADPDGQARLAAFETTLTETGWIDGRNCEIDVRWSAGDLERMRGVAKEVVALAPDIVVVMTTPGLLAIQRETKTVPVVFIQVSDPVGAGFVNSMSLPGGNMTGFANFEASMGSKWLELLKRIAPNVSQVAVLVHTGITSQLEFFRAAQEAAPTLGVQITAANVPNRNEVDRAIADLTSRGSDGLIVLPDPIFNTLRESIVDSNARHRLPAIYPFRFYAEVGGLVSYGIDQIEQWRGTGRYVDRILRGEKPAVLPVQAPTKFELVINLKTAKSLGLTIAPSLIASADEVIE